MQESAERVIAWAKANPVVAAALVGGAILVGWLLMRGGSQQVSYGGTSEEALGGGGGAGDDPFDVIATPEFLSSPTGLYWPPAVVDGGSGGNGNAPPGVYVTPEPRRDIGATLVAMAHEAGYFTGRPAELAPYVAGSQSGIPPEVPRTGIAPQSGIVKSIQTGATKLTKDAPKTTTKASVQTSYVPPTSAQLLAVK